MGLAIVLKRAIQLGKNVVTTSYYRGIFICADTLNTLLHALYEMDQLFAQYDALKDVALAELTSGLQ